MEGPLFSQELRKGLCSHLIVIKPSGDKFTYAKTWGKIEIVTPEWFWESLERKGILTHSAQLTHALTFHHLVTERRAARTAFQN